ncbi:E3 SUMO-protein ligase ZNF451-like isoform X1 [Argonauta hians]
MDDSVIILDSSGSEASVLEISSNISPKKVPSRRKKKNSVIVISDSSDCEMISPMLDSRCRQRRSVKNFLKKSTTESSLSKSDSPRMCARPRVSISLTSLHTQLYLNNPSKQSAASPVCLSVKSKRHRKKAIKKHARLLSLKKSRRLTKSPVKSPFNLSSPTKPSPGTSTPLNISTRSVTWSAKKLARRSSKKPISLLPTPSRKSSKRFASKSVTNLLKNASKRTPTPKRTKSNVSYCKVSAPLFDPRPTGVAGTISDGQELPLPSHPHSTDNDETLKKLCCPVLNCEIKFSSEEKLENHMAMMKHEQCNPLKLAIDGTSPSEIITYICPKCWKEYKLEKMCVDHQVSYNHSPFFKPIAISSYICQFCLHIFPTKLSCMMHMDSNRHYTPAFNFQIDSDHIPIPLPKGLEADFRSKCALYSSNVMCVECLVVLSEVNSISNHLNRRHLIKCVSKESLKDIFSTCIGDVTCSYCRQIFPQSTSNSIGKKHQCTSYQCGVLLKRDDKSFREFVLRSSLSLFASDMSSKPTGPVLQNLHNANRPPYNSKPYLKRPLESMGNITKRRKVLVTGSFNKITSAKSTRWDQPPSSFGCEQFTAPHILRTHDLDCYRDKSEFISKLSQMKTIIYLDLDNWGGIFKHIQHYFPEKTFLWVFYGAQTRWIPPKSLVYKKLVQDGCFFLNPKSGGTKQAADFALVLHIGKMDERLPEHIKFTIMSGDKGFYEICHQFRNSQRPIQIINPHCFTVETYNSIFQLL